MTDTAAPVPFEVEAVLAEGQRRAGLTDYGDTWFKAPMKALMDSLRDEAKLTPEGHAAALERILGGLVNILRLVEDLKKHPEILKEEVHVAGVVCGLPRTGSTLIHRTLANAQGLTAPIWWEVMFPSPFPEDPAFGESLARRKHAKGVVDWMCEAAPDLMSIHPMDSEAPDEEIMIMEQVFVSTSAESMQWVPSYAAYVEGMDQQPAYDWLVTNLKYLQWQNPSRRGKRWILKTPQHLTALRFVLKTFPDAKVIMTHRDPLQTVPSYCSMVYSLTKMTSNDVDAKAIGAHWLRRWSNALRDFIDTRASTPGDRFVDVMYADQIKDPLGTAIKVLERLGEPVNDTVIADLKAWMAGNSRENRAAHHYTLEEFGLSPELIEKHYGFYRDVFFR